MKMVVRADRSQRRSRPRRAAQKQPKIKTIIALDQIGMR